MKKKNNNTVPRRVAWLWAAGAMLLLAACNDNDFVRSDNPSETEQTESQGIGFSAAVSSSQQASRADGTIVNLGETKLPPTDLATNNYRVGIFGAYTGKYKWNELVTLAEKASPTEEEKQVLNDYYTANQMYNVPASVDADGNLTYSPLRFWPNQQHEEGSPAGNVFDYMTFWAYYPYNPTATMGEYGISMTNEAMGIGKGMGSVKFTMHPDAAEQNDFLISMPVTDCNREKYPLLRDSEGDPELPTQDPPTYSPKPVPFRLYHMLAQVRFYAFIRGDDRMVYVQEGEGDDIKDKVADDAWFDAWATSESSEYSAYTEKSKYADLTTELQAKVILDAYGNIFVKTTDGKAYCITQEKTYTKAEFVDLGLRIPVEEKCVRWDRTDGVWDVNHTRRRANITYQMELNNIKTTTTFFPKYDAEGNATIDIDEPSTLGSATVNHYIMNPYWFRFDDNGQRYQVNDTYMFGDYEGTPAATGSNEATDTQKGDGIDWSSAAYTSHIASLGDINDPLHYLQGSQEGQEAELRHTVGTATKHYNYAPGNILMVVPQTLEDDDVPHVVINATGKDTNGNDVSAKVTVNMLKMGISWRSGYIYCYAFLDDLRPGDDKVRGPESINVLFNTNWYTDQW